MNELPIPFLKAALCIEADGSLRWLRRPLTHFKSVTAAKRWNSRYASGRAGSLTDDGHIKVQFQINGKRVFFLAHRIVWALTEGQWPPHLIDHANRIGSDNRRSNLRKASPMNNGQNHPAQKNNTSGYKGVSRNEGRWLATIRIDGKKKNLGRFDSPEEAFEAYKAAARKHHGEFAAF